MLLIMSDEEFAKLSEKERVLAVLKLHHAGKDRAVGALDLANHCGIERKDARRCVRRLVAELVADGNCIAGTDAGYFIIESQEELDAYLRNIENRIYSLQSRKTDLENAWLTSQPG